MFFVVIQCLLTVQTYQNPGKQIKPGKYVDTNDNYFMTSDNVFSDWLRSLVTFFDKSLYSTRKKSREVNITFQRFSP
jgi:hypothetical protein